MKPLHRLFVVLPLLASNIVAAAEIAVLSEATWSEYAPQGKEVDAIYGDIVVRNDKLVAVIAQPIDGRNANMSVKNAGGCLIDFTPRDKQNDQLATFYPLGKAINWRSIETEPPLKSDGKPASNTFVGVYVTTEPRPGELAASTLYMLVDNADHLAVSTKLTNLTDKPLKYSAKDELNTQGGFVKGSTDELSWAYDRWWNAAYGFTTDAPKDGEITIPAKESITIMRRLYVARGLDMLQRLTSKDPIVEATHTLRVVDSSDRPIADAYVEVMHESKLLTAGRTSAEGQFEIIASGGQEVTVLHPSYPARKIPLDKPEVVMKLKVPGTVVAAITDDKNAAVPCKVKFTGVEETKDPVFFDKSGEHAVGNLYYSHDGKFSLELPPGKYDVCVSHGPEYDIVEQQIEVLSGSQTPLAAKLVRSVETPGFISADFHNHASPSGDNTSSQFGRVLNLLAEHVEFAPCTEHNRVSSYAPHLERLGAVKLMATCSGIELTGTPFHTNHHNAFPIKMHEHKQDGGGPTIDDTEVSVERLALWDDRSHKLIQQNHPDIGYLFFDKNGDGKPDEGYQRALGHLDCVEVHPPHHIFSKPTLKGKTDTFMNNTMFNWLQLLNQGHRIAGVVNTDAHYNIHGSGWLRNYIECDTDDPAQIDVAEMVHAAEHGHMVMTNAPYLVATLEAEKPGKQARGGPGDDVVAPGGKGVLRVKVQCANWYDIDRVQVFINGLPDPKLNFTRKANPDAFGDKVVKFERELKLELAGDAHVIVAAVGENSGLGRVMGPEHEDDKPCAVTNPIFVDVDGNGFQANKDTLGVPLPVKASGSK